MHASKDQYDLQYKASDYLLTDTEKYHHQGKHIYEINKIALEADVIINMPKPKDPQVGRYDRRMQESCGYNL